MAFSLRSVGAWEKEYHFEDAVAVEDIFNGEIGIVADGEFTKDADGTSIVMQVEVGDEAGLDKYQIAKGSHVRTLKLDEIVGKELIGYGYPLPDTFAVGTTVGKLKVTKVIGNGGAVVEVQA